MFTTYQIESKVDYFEELSKVELEDVTKGRKGGVLVDCDGECVPIVRTTTKYEKPAIKFRDIHYRLVEDIRKVTKIKGLRLNNGLTETYDTKYTKMGFHTDQAQDLEDDSYICVFSCYDKPTSIRTLKIINKETGKESQVEMEHNSVLVFSTDINKKHKHAIVLEKNNGENNWIGITFRLSKTFIEFKDSKPFFRGTDTELTLATKDEKDEFYKCRREENKSVKYTYPDMSFSISKSDLMEPI